jgi:hypothetical protein
MIENNKNYRPQNIICERSVIEYILFSLTVTLHSGVFYFNLKSISSRYEIESLIKIGFEKHLLRKVLHYFYGNSYFNNKK